MAMTPQSSELRVVFDDDNQMYTEGMWALLEEIFTKEMGIRLSRITALSRSSALGFADIYVSRFCAGMDAMCRPEFKSRKPDSLLIVVKKGRGERPLRTRLSCLHNSIFLLEHDSLSEIRNRIIQAWYRRSWGKTMSCKTCRSVLLTESEEVIARCLSQGLPLSELVHSPELTQNAVSSRKRGIMSKFGLGSDAELLAFSILWQQYEIDQKSTHATVPAFASVDTIRKKARNERSRSVIQRLVESADDRNSILKGGANPSVSAYAKSGRKPKTAKKENVLAALKMLCHSPSTPETLPRTRDVADICADSVYVTRYWLGLLEKEGRISSTLTPGISRRKVLRWYPNAVDRCRQNTTTD